MLALLVLNAIGLICGFRNIAILMYIIFGITWTAFFCQYKKITWKFYERMTENESINVIVDVKLTNAVTVFLIMGMIYFLVYFKAGGLCVIASALQCFVFQLLYTFVSYCNKNVVMLIGFMVELVLAVVCVL